MSTDTVESIDKQLISQFNSLLKQENSQECPKTGLLLSDAFFYCLKTCLMLKDSKWLLALCDIDNLKEINERIGYNDTDFIIESIGRIIKRFVDAKPTQTKGFRFDSNNEIVPGKGDLFAILIRYHLKIENAETRLRLLLKHVSNIQKETITIGIAKMQTNDDCNNWIQRCLECVRHVKKIEPKGNNVFGNYNDTKDTNTDIKNIKSTNNNFDYNEIKQILPRKEEFKMKGKEIASLGDKDWVLALLDCDDVTVFIEQNTRGMANEEIIKAAKEISRLSLILPETCFVYSIGGDEFAIILYNNEKDSNSLRSIDIIDTLLDNIRSKSKLTVSIGFSNYNDEKEEDFYEWENRCNGYLKVAKKTGKNKAYWGQKLHEKVNCLDKTDVVAQDDWILFQSLQSIEVLCWSLLLCFFFHHTSLRFFSSR